MGKTINNAHSPAKLRTKKSLLASFLHVFFLKMALRNLRQLLQTSSEARLALCMRPAARTATTQAQPTPKAPQAQDPSGLPTGLLVITGVAALGAAALVRGEIVCKHRKPKLTSFHAICCAVVFDFVCA